MRAEQEREYVEFVRARAITLRRVAYRLCGDWHGAEDLVQRAFVLLYRHWRRASAAASLDAYVRTMLLNVYLEDRRGWWSRRVTPFAEPVSESGSVDPGAEGRVDLMVALSRLSPGQRAVLVLRYWEGLDVAETAEALAYSAGTVKSQTAPASMIRLSPMRRHRELRRLQCGQRVDLHWVAGHRLKLPALGHRGQHDGRLGPGEGLTDALMPPGAEGKERRLDPVGRTVRRPTVRIEDGQVRIDCGISMQRVERKQQRRTGRQIDTAEADRPGGPAGEYPRLGIQPQRLADHAADRLQPRDIGERHRPIAEHLIDVGRDAC